MSLLTGATGSIGIRLSPHKSGFEAVEPGLQLFLRYKPELAPYAPVIPYIIFYSSKICIIIEKMKKYHNLPKYEFISSEMSPNIYFFEISSSLYRLFLLKTKRKDLRTSMVNVI
jgi:hypothetical protein